MSESPTPTRHRFLTAALLLGLAIPTAGAGVLPVEIELRARALHAGEPVRVDVVSTEPLASLGGAFLGHDVFFVRDEQVGNGERWTGWSMIALDQQPGIAAIEVSGHTVTGRAVGGTRALAVEDHAFPSETLSVAPRYVEPPPEVQERLARERRKLDALYRSRRAVPFQRRAFVSPVPGQPTSVFGTKRLYNGKPRAPHPGLDLRAAIGTPVKSSGEGRVSLAEDLYYSGNTVILDHGGGMFTLYAHLSELRVREGETVEAGQIVGLAGATGRVTGPHLHWGAKIGDRPFDPTALLDDQLFVGAE